MGNNQLEYLEEERKKLWEEIVIIKNKITDLEKKAPDSEQEAKRAASKASEYKNEAKMSFESIKKTLENLEDINKELLKQRKLFYTLNKYIENKEKEATDNNEQIKTILNNAKQYSTDIEPRINKINENLDTLNSNISTMQEQRETISKIFSEAESLKTKISSIHGQVIDNKNKIEDFIDEIEGYDYDEEGETKHEIGLKEKLANEYKSIDSELERVEEEVIDLRQDINKWKEDFINNKEKDFSDIKEKINSLLPGALTTGLSFAYKEKRELEEKEKKNSTYIFNWCIVGLIAISLIPFGLSAYWIYKGLKILDQVIYDLPRIVLAIVPLYIPILWLAIFSNKKINLSKRLIEEYSHKETLAKTYEGLSKQISKIEDDEMSNELKIKILHNMVNTSSENPGKLITDYNKADHPLFDVLDKSIQLGNSLDKLSNIPGMKSIAKKIIATENQKKEKLEKQAEKVLETNNEEENEE